MWRPIESFCEQREKHNTSILVNTGYDGEVTRILHVGERVSFRTPRTSGVQGEILEIDHGAEYPIKIEYTDVFASRRIQSFHPDEFTGLVKYFEEK